MTRLNYFSRSEFIAQCDAKERATVANSQLLQANQDELLMRLNIIRHLHGQAIRINSWYRDTAHNKRVGGSATSQHLTGEAVDITSADNDVLLTIIRMTIQALNIDYGQIIAYGTNPIRFIHISLPCKSHINEFLTKF